MAAHVGIWLDKREAKLVVLENNKVDFTCIESQVEEFHPKGGSGTRFKGGPQDVVQDSKYTERKKHQLKRYFTDIINHLPELDRLVIFGPAETGIHLEQEILKHHKDISEKLLAVVKADSMTDNQIKAWVEYFFKKNKEMVS